MIALVVGVSVGFVLGAAWGSSVTRMRLARFMYQYPDISEAVRRAVRGQS